MTEDRLNGLALLHIHKNVNIDRERVLDAFDANGNRRIGLVPYTFDIQSLNLLLNF